jgi:hypothetical protein
VLAKNNHNNHNHNNHNHKIHDTTYPPQAVNRVIAFLEILMDNLFPFRLALLLTMVKRGGVLHLANNDFDVVAGVAPLLQSGWSVELVLVGVLKQPRILFSFWWEGVGELTSVRS